MERKLAKKIIQLLCDRKGFNGWWYDIDEDIQEEILKEISETITKSVDIG